MIGVLLSHGVAQAQDDATPQIARIVGGQQSASGDFPSVVALLTNRANQTQFIRQGCGGTLIAPRWVLTAAHCVMNDGRVVASDYWTVMVGNTVLDHSDPANRFGEVAVLNVFPHPQYGTPRQHANDIALLELAEAVEHQPIALHASPGSTVSGVQAYAVGWGALSDDANPTFDDHQRYVDVPVVDNALCNEPISYDGEIDESQLCAGFAEGGKDSCQGDSGGPLIVGIDGLQVQVGVVSYGFGCARENYYGVYTNVSHYRAWISNFVDATFLPRALLADDQASAQQPTLSERRDGGGGALVWWLIPMALVWKCRR